MSTEIPGAAGHIDHLDADAVCIQCSTVNPEGTLICKTCGNNLRDQRSTRMVADQMMDGGGTKQSNRQRLSIALTTLGILVILYVTLNLGAIESALVRSQLATVDHIQALWTGADNSIYTELAAALTVRPSTQAIIQARNDPVAPATVDGKYVIFSQDRSVGTANVSQRGSAIYFVAKLFTGQELRGKATTGQQYIRVRWEFAGYRSADGYTAIAGMAQRKPDGTLEIFGQEESLNEEPMEAGYSATGYPLPTF